MASKKTADKEFAGEQRKGYLAALKNELEGYKRTGNEDRQADVIAEIKRVTASPTGRTGTNPATTNTAAKD